MGFIEEGNLRSYIDPNRMIGANRKKDALRRFLQSRHFHIGLCFAAAFVVVWMVGALPKSPLFWKILDTRFAADERYQIQRLFLPDLERQIPAVFIGDAMFHSSLQSSDRVPAAAGSVVINGYDANDLESVFDGLHDGQRFTDTSVCSLVIQISPIFMVRSKALHEEQATRLIREVKVSSSLRRRFRDLLRILSAWAETENTMPALAADALRPRTLVGQAQFADKTRENWNLAFEKIGKFEGPIIAVLDTRGTDWPQTSDVVEVTKHDLDVLADQHETISWITLEDFDAGRVPGCPS